MRKIIFMLLATALTLLAYNDFDMDGVEDSKDQCPNSLLSDLVDINGCTKKSLKSPHHFDIIFGLSYSQSDYSTLENTDTINSNLQLDYYYKNFSLQASSSYYDSHSVSYNNSGINDSFIGAYYKFTPLEKLSLRIGAGAIIPTYDSDLKNNETDYTASLSASYMFENFNIFGAYNFTNINDSDTVDVSYQDTNSFNGGLGFYPSSKLYLSASYYTSQSIYANTEDINTASIYAFYNINQNWFTNFNYAYGLSDSASDNYLSLRLGYYF